jgi:hypothetical protein
MVNKAVTNPVIGYPQGGFFLWLMPPKSENTRQRWLESQKTVCHHVLQNQACLQAMMNTKRKATIVPA